MGWGTQCSGSAPQPGDKNTMTHYWDCSKPSCSWPGKPGKPSSWCKMNAPDKSLPGPTDETSVADGGDAITCSTQYPWIAQDADGKKVLYGFAARSGETPACGQCYKLDFDNARNIDHAIVMVTNGGDSQEGNFDLLVPGGGVGQKNGCYQGPNGTDTMYEKGWNLKAVQDQVPYGGFENSENSCDVAFPEDAAARTACHEVLFGVFEQLGCNEGSYPGSIIINNATPVTCPSSLQDKF